tara:strand:+ start:1445 stop:1834 length:390 start_codon:yes stop_codon:yes gene_type:complete
MSNKLKYLFRAELDTVYVSAEHEVMMLTYYYELDDALRYLKPSKDKLRLLNELIDVITDYSSSFSEDKDEYFYEWIRIIPTNLTYTIAGFIAGLKDEDNVTECNISYSAVLQSASRCLTSLNEIEPVDE